MCAVLLQFEYPQGPAGNTTLSSLYLVQFSRPAPGELLSGSGSGCGLLKWAKRGGEGRGQGKDCLAAGRNPFSVHHAAAFRLTQSYVFHFFVTHFHFHLHLYKKKYIYIYICIYIFCQAVSFFNGFFVSPFGHETILSGASWVSCAAKYATHYLLCISACPCARASCLACRLVPRFVPPPLCHVI